jgi:MFS family permease
VTWRPHHTLWAVLALGVAANQVFRRGLGPVLPPLREEFALSYAEAGLVVFVPLVTYTVMQLPAGYLGDRVGRARVLIGGCLVWGLAVAVAGTAAGFPGLLALLAVAGLGEGVLFGNDRPLIATHSPPGRQATGQAVTLAAGGLGTIVGVVGAGLAVESLGWRAAFLFFAGPVLVYAAAVWWWVSPLPAPPGAAGAPGALAGAGSPGWRGLFSPSLLAMYAAGAGIAFTTWFLSTWGPDVFLDAGARGPAQASVLASLFGVAILAGLPVAGLASDRLHDAAARARLVVWLLGAAGAVCLLLGAAIAGRAGIPVLVALTMAVAVLTWGAWSPLMVNVAAEAPPARLGLAYGLTNALCQCGSLAAPVAGGWVRDLTASFAGGAYLAGGVLWVAAAGVLAVYRRREEQA